MMIGDLPPQGGLLPWRGLARVHQWMLVAVMGATAFDFFLFLRGQEAGFLLEVVWFAGVAPIFYMILSLPVLNRPGIHFRITVETTDGTIEGGGPADPYFYSPLWVTGLYAFVFGLLLLLPLVVIVPIMLGCWGIAYVDAKKYARSTPSYTGLYGFAFDLRQALIISLFPAVMIGLVFPISLATFWVLMRRLAARRAYA